jgi:biopolymer transport protein TolQ
VNLQGLFGLAQGFANVILYILLISSVVSIAMILERFFFLGKITRENKAFRVQARALLESGDVNQIETLAQNDSLPQKGLLLGLKHVKNYGEKGLEEIFNSYMIIERPRIEKFLNFLATVGSNAPFIGLLGTVMGIMKAFNDLAQNSAAGNEVVMLGIAHALVATAIGLFVAIPAVVAYNYYQKTVKETVQAVEVAKELCLAYAKVKKG